MQELKDVRAWPYDRPARVTVQLENGDQISEFCEAALGSPARPLESSIVLEKISQLSDNLAPNLKNAVVFLREQLGKNPDITMKTNQWIHFF
jgi:hypothetical protein